jgi:hypothetical protein
MWRLLTLRLGETGNQRIEERLYSKYGKLPISPPDLIGLVLTFSSFILLGKTNL